MEGGQCVDDQAIPGQRTNKEGLLDVENTMEHWLCGTPGVHIRTMPMSLCILHRSACATVREPSERVCMRSVWYVC